MECRNFHLTEHLVGERETYESLWCERDEGHTGWHGSWSPIERATIVWARPGVTSMP